VGPFQGLNMIKGIALKRVDITDQEYTYYEELVKQYTTDETDGSSYFVDLFDTDKYGKITLIRPTKNIPWAVLFFIQNLMINQWLRSYDSRISNIEKGKNNGK